MNTKEHHCEYRPAHTAEECPENTLQSQTIEEIVEEFRQTFSIPTGKDNWTPDTYPHPLGIINWLREALTTLQTQHQQELEKAVREEKEAKDNAYRERNLLVQALTKIYPAHLARHDENDATWEKDWMWIVYVEIPTRTKVVSGDQHNHVPESEWFKEETQQISWHIHDSERELFSHLETKENNWDGHDTKEKYRRLQALTPPNK